MVCRTYLHILLAASYVLLSGCSKEQNLFGSSPSNRRNQQAAEAATPTRTTTMTPFNFSGGGGGGGGSAGGVTAPRTSLNWTWQRTCDERKTCNYRVCSAPEERCYPCIPAKPGAPIPASSQTPPWSQAGFTCSFDSWACPYIIDMCGEFPPAHMARTCKKVCRVCGC